MSHPPSSLPSPTSSASSQHLPFAMSITPHIAPRAPSAVSHASRDVKSPHRPNYDDPSTPQPPFQPSHPHPYPGLYIPPVTSSPPPHTPAYIPPPQHALPPDPIHSHQPYPMQAPMGWPGPAGPPNHWRGPAPYPGFRVPNGYDGLPNRIPMGYMNGIGRPGSAGDLREGGSRERRREKSQRDDDDDEVISTIFVVGFPDDMSEREFQNIFTFAPGFEAATLKFPSGSGRSREPTAAFLAELAQVAAAQQADPSNPEYAAHSSALEEALAALQFSNSTSSVATPSALTPSLSASVFGGLPSLPLRRQTIGFARFKTRQDAINAKEQLQGKRIDVLSGNTLKAEMAKKNLHTKRSATNERDDRSRLSHPREWEYEKEEAKPQPPEVTSPRQSNSKALLALAEEADELEGWNVAMGMDGLTQAGPNPVATIQPTSPRVNLSPSLENLPKDANTNGGMNGYRPNGYVSEYMGSPTFENLDRVGLGGPNPADQNPPINTLYVGNLPAISPPTHPPNFLEESLRGLFSRCQGYKRMSFRQKINGPMCFVEFEDVPFAAQAIKDLYGNNLSGLVKGGIRLSYSKNSLGQRGSAHPAGMNTSLFGGIAHTVALAGMSAPQNGQPNAAYGLQLHTHQPQSAPIPMPGDVRRGSEVSGPSGLSPTAQPFNASLPLATSPRSRYFGTSPSTANNGNPSSYSTTHSTSSSNPSSQSHAQSVPLPISPPTNGNGAQFSPVSSPIRTPASFSWVSSGSVGGAVGNGGYGFDPFSMGSQPGGLSLNGAASAWGQGGSSGTPM